MSRPGTLVLVTFAALLGACASSGDAELAERCKRAVSKVTLEEMYNAPGAPSAPSGGEKVIMEAARAAGRAKCEAEGLTKEQAACFEPIHDIESLFRAADCPAIAANKPSWFQVPPPEARREALERMEAREAAE